MGIGNRYKPHKYGLLGNEVDECEVQRFIFHVGCGLRCFYIQSSNFVSCTASLKYRQYVVFVRDLLYKRFVEAAIVSQQSNEKC